MAKGTLYTFSASMVGARMDYADGTADAIVWEDTTPEIRAALMAHGWKQKVADGAAIPRDTETGRSATTAEKIAAMRAIAARLASGLWNAAGGGGGGQSSAKALLIRAMAEFSGKTIEQAREYIESRTKTQQAALAVNPRIKPIIDRLQEETVSGLDSDELLDGFMDEEEE